MLRTLHRQQPFDFIHAHYASPCGVIALLARRWMHVPVALSVHGADVTYTAKQHPLSAAIIRWVFRNADIVFANSRWTACEIVRLGGLPEKVQVVHLGGNAPHRDMHLESTRSEVVRLLSVGYLEERKGHSYVLKAIKRLVDQGYRLRYVVVGSGPQDAKLRALTQELGLAEFVSFEGYKAHQDVWSYFANCDIFALPSWQEAFGIVYIESLGQGKPVVGCEGAGGPEDLKLLGECIELVKPRDVQSLVDALKRLLDDPERRRQMGAIGRKIVAEHFTWERNTLETIKIYQDVLQAHTGGIFSLRI
jgi:glycosyltransferase involved in cell wall biosynthesis